MAQLGHCIFFTPNTMNHPETILARLLRLSGATELYGAFRTKAEDHEWKDVSQSLRGASRTIVEEHSLDDAEYYYKDVTIEGVPLLIKDGVSLTVMVGSCPLAERVETAIRSSIDEAIRGEFCPSDLSFVVGFHDLCEFSENPRGRYFGRAFLSIKFSGYSTPLDSVSFRERVIGLQEIKDVKAELEAITGGLSECIYWEV